MAYVNPGAPGTFERVEKLERRKVEAALARLNMVARTMDSLFAIPGTRLRLGVDSVIGLVPVVGDIVAHAVAAYLIWEAKQLGVSKLTLWRMVGNTLIDTVVGAVPLVGDAFDVVFKANMKNMRLLQRHLEKQGYQMAAPGAGSGPIIQGDYRRVA
ncbi:DUF4112 domain-containing protein [Hyphomicrobium sp. xq]|uniref:DUF4112 domain-containing protein n=1 Tax=Hyphomicrobium album TaxID=2665159 RepID=A0A6I3KR10_9HYPH|nr:DUF4112 domain-containing protein [Hyphomicrobium album]MTD95151.1 DUF4112 domain-containing protein [Hyphomicrobium album]